MSAQENLELALNHLNLAIDEVQAALNENKSLKDYYGYTLNQAKEHAGEAACKVEKALEYEGENWNN